MQTIYLVMGGVFHEKDAPLVAYTSQTKAEAFKDQCQKYHETRPPFPEGMTPSEELKASAEIDRWEQDHPAGESGGFFDCFFVRLVNLLT